MELRISILFITYKEQSQAYIFDPLPWCSCRQPLSPPLASSDVKARSNVVYKAGHPSQSNSQSIATPYISVLFINQYYPSSLFFTLHVSN
jgi:hypothetical protein